jgi:hypothetical protein
MEMENMLQMIKQMMTRLEGAEARADARQENANAEMKASQETASAEMKSTYAEIEARAEARHERFLARLDELTPYGEGTTTCQIETTSCSEEMDATTLEANPEATEAAVER